MANYELVAFVVQPLTIFISGKLLKGVGLSVASECEAAKHPLVLINVSIYARRISVVFQSNRCIKSEKTSIDAVSARQIVCQRVPLIYERKESGIDPNAAWIPLRYFCRCKEPDAVGARIKSRGCRTCGSGCSRSGPYITDASLAKML